jgi:hypothetical protein
MILINLAFKNQILFVIHFLLERYIFKNIIIESIIESATEKVYKLHTYLHNIKWYKYLQLVLFQ